MTVGPSHNQVDAVLSDDIQEKSFLAIAGNTGNSLGNADVMPLKIFCHVGNLRVCIFGPWRLCHCNADLVG